MTSVAAGLPTAPAPGPAMAKRECHSFTVGVEHSLTLGNRNWEKSDTENSSLV